MIVLDASALIELLLHTEAGDRIADRIADPDLQLHVPHRVDVEVAQAMRRFVRAGDIGSLGNAAAAATTKASSWDAARRKWPVASRRLRPGACPLYKRQLARRFSIGGSVTWPTPSEDMKL